MLRNDPSRVAFKAVASASRARILRDGEEAPEALEKVLAVVAGKLFHPSLTAATAWKEAGVEHRGLEALFKASTGKSLTGYIAFWRIKVTDILMATTDLDLTSISEKVGYDCYPTFAEDYKRLKGKLPSEVTRERLPPPLIDDETSLKAAWGLLDDEEMARYLEDLRRIYPAIAGRAL